MKMNATKLTIALVALLLALTCVFAACGKKNNTDTPDDTTPVDNTPATVDTVAKEDLNAIAENLKSAYAANYVDLYAPATATDIEAAKSAALINIFAATSKEEAQKVADDFIAYLKSQKTIIDTIATLVEKIGEVSLKDADALNELTDVVATLDAAYAGTNTAKQAALDKYKADAATQKTIKDIVNRFNVLKGAKNVADTAKGAFLADGKTKATDDGLNLKIAELKADFTEEGKEFRLSDFGAYEDLLKAMADFAKEYNIVVDSDAYADVFDVDTLKVAKAALDAAFGEDSVLTSMLAVVDEAKALEAAADEAQWREYVYVDSDSLKSEIINATAPAVSYNVEVKLADGTKMYAAAGSDFALLFAKTVAGVATTPAQRGTYTNAFVVEDGATYYKDGTVFYATEKAAADANVKKTTKVEVTLKAYDAATSAIRDFADYKLALKAAVEKAVAAKDAILKTHSTKELSDNYNYGSATDPVAPAIAKIDKIAADYKASVVRAFNDYKVTFGTLDDSDIYDLTVLNLKTNVDLDKDATIGTYALTKEIELDSTIGKFTNKKAADNQKAIYKAIESAIKNFTAQDEASGALVSGKDQYLDNTYTGTNLDVTDYSATDGSNKHGFNLVNGTPSINYVAWTYRYQLEEKDDLPTTLNAFDALKTLATEDGNAVLAKAALRFLAMYIGDGDYADSYDFSEYKKYEPAFDDEVLYMTDRDITEVAVPAVVKIHGEAVNVAKDETNLGAKLLSPYTVAKALVAEEEKIVAAKEKVQEELIEAALALRTAGDAKAVADARKFYNRIADGRELNERLEYGLDPYFNGYTIDPTLDNSALFTYLGVSTLGTLDAKVQTKPTIENKRVNLLIAAAETALSTAKTSFNKIEDKAVVAKPEYVQFYKLEDYQATIDSADDDMDANNAALNTFAALINEANRQLEVAKAGVAAKVLDGDLTSATDTADNITSKAAQLTVERLTSMQSIFSNYGSFYADYRADYAENAVYYIGDYSTNAKATGAARATFDTYLKKFRTNAVAQKDYDNVIDRLVKVVKGSSPDTTIAATPSTPNISSADNARLAETKKTNEKDLKKALANYETKILASYVYDANTGAGNTTLNDAAADISYFQNEFYADYVNLKVSYVIAGETFEFDYLTETFKNRVLYNSQSVIQKVLDYADTVAGPIVASAKAALSTGDDSWKATVSATIDNLGATFNTVTSIKDAETKVNSSVVADSYYKYDTAKNVINGVDDGGSPATNNATTVALIKEYVRTH